MTTATSRWSLLLLLALAVSGCGLPVQLSRAPHDSEGFAQGIDRYLAADDLTALREFAQTSPQSEWRKRAEDLIANAEQQRQRQAQLEKKLLLRRDDKTLASCEQEKAALAQEKKLLEETLKGLKEALIDSELRTK